MDAGLIGAPWWQPLGTEAWMCPCCQSSRQDGGSVQGVRGAGFGIDFKGRNQKSGQEQCGCRMRLTFTVVGLKWWVPQSHGPCFPCRDNLYQVELEPSTSTELRYQRVRTGCGTGVLRGEMGCRADWAEGRDLRGAGDHTPLTPLYLCR